MRNTLRLGSLCTGYGGLDLGVGQVLDVEHAWHAELDPDASKVLAARWPSVPNLGDLRAVDWSVVEPVDILTAGFPCQPVSAAGRRKGINDERWLWDDLHTAVGRMDPRPRMLVLENVPGLLTANSGNAMARVVHGLASLGYVGRYRLLRAADVGAAHRRERWFCVAHLADAADDQLEEHARDDRFHPERASVGRRAVELAGAGGDRADRIGALAGAHARAGGPAAGDATAAGDSLTLLPTPRATDGTKGGPNQRGSSGDLMLPSAVMQLLPTPAARDERRGAGWGDQPGRPLSETIHRLLPTPTAATYGNNQSPSAGAAVRPSLDSLAGMERWGDYGPAIARWEAATGRPAPEPTEPGRLGKPRLAPRFVEWLMGLPAGWVTDHLPRNPALRVLGNGVVPAQAAAAVLALAVRIPRSRND